MINHSSLVASHSSAPFYVTGGTLSRDALSYVTRQADDDLYEGLTRGQFSYVLTSRQMGKSSLMVRTAARLREAGAGVVLLDLTAIGQNLTAEQWYGGLLTQIGQQLELDDELEEFWDAHPKLGPLQRWMQAIRHILLPRYPGPVVIFVDEIDAVRSLPFSTDEFFAAIREFYNRRTEDEELRRLTFCLLGVASPSDLIRDTRTTPFNVGQRIELNDFTEAEAAPLAEGLRQSADTGTRLLKRILYWTNGHPYLTQRLCQAAAEGAEKATTDDVDRLCRELFLSRQAQERDDNLLFVRERMLRSEVDLAGLLTVHAEVLAHKRVPDDVANPLITTLRLSGITRMQNSLLKVRNRIYEQVFGREWVKENMPDAELRRQRAAYRRGLFRAAAIAALIIAVIASLAFVAVRQRDRAEQQEQSNRWLLYSAHMNLAARDWHDSSIERMRDLLALHVPKPGQPDLRGFDWYLLWALAHQDRQTVLFTSAWRSMDFSPDLRMIATGEDTDVKLWDIATGRQLNSLKEAGLRRAVSFSPDGKLLAADSEDNSIRLWDITAGRELHRLKGHTKFISSLKFSRDGKLLASGSEDQTVKLWKIETGILLATLRSHTNIGYLRAFSPDGRKVATGSLNEPIKLWDVATGKELMTLKEHPAQGGAIRPQITQVEFSPDSKRILAIRFLESLAMWDAATGRALPRLEGYRGMMALAFSPDGKLMAAGDRDRTIQLWDVGDWKVIKSFTGHSHHILNLAFSGDGKTLASASTDGTIKLWDLTAEPNPLVLANAELMALAPDGRKLATTAMSGKEVNLWDTATGELIATFRSDMAEVTSMSYSPDGKTLAFGSRDKTARLWDVATGKERFVLKGHSGEVWWPAFSPNGKLLATGSDDKTVRLWDVTTGQELAKLEGHEGDIMHVAFSPDGRALASAGFDMSVRLWDVAGRRELTTLKGHTEAVYSVAFSPDGKLLATASEDGMVKLWDVAARKELSTFKGHASSVFVLAFSPDGKRLASAGDDLAVRLWDVSTGQELAAFRRHTGLIYSLAFSPDGKTLFSRDTDKNLYIWRAATEQEVRARRK